MVLRKKHSTLRFDENQWDELRLWQESSIGMSPFEVVYGVNPSGPLDLLLYQTK